MEEWWPNGGRNGRMAAEWQNGGNGRRNGQMSAEWWNGRMVEWQEWWNG